MIEQKMAENGWTANESAWLAGGGMLRNVAWVIKRSLDGEPEEVYPVDFFSAQYAIMVGFDYCETCERSGMPVYHWMEEDDFQQWLCTDCAEVDEFIMIQREEPPCGG